MDATENAEKCPRLPTLTIVVLATCPQLLLVSRAYPAAAAIEG